MIRKQQRHSPASATPLAFFYVLDGRIYQAPTLHASLTSRLARLTLPVCLLASMVLPADFEAKNAPPQSRCLFNVKAAFRRIQQDIDPLQSIRPGNLATPGRPQCACTSRLAHEGPPRLGLQTRRRRRSLRRRRLPSA